MLLDMLLDSMIPLFLVVLFGIILWSKKTFQKAETKYFWLTLISGLLLMFEDMLETMTAKDPALVFWRITLSILGYTLRSTAALGLLFVILPRKNRRFYWWIPCLIMLFINCTAFFSDIAFGFGDDYGFYRGPLGIVSFIVPFFYSLMTLIVSLRRLSEKSGAERFIVPICILFCIAATVKGVLYGGSELNTAIIISSIFFYIVLYSHDNRLDVQTGLFNKRTARILPPQSL